MGSRRTNMLLRRNFSRLVQVPIGKIDINVFDKVASLLVYPFPLKERICSQKTKISPAGVAPCGMSQNALKMCLHWMCIYACTCNYSTDTSGECPPLGADSVGICVEECSFDIDCPLGLICCSNGCGHTCQRRYIPGRQLLDQRKILGRLPVWIHCNCTNNTAENQYSTLFKNLS